MVGEQGALCPEIRVAARDLEAKDLAEVVARPAAADGRIPAGRAARYTAELEIDRQDYEEELDEIRAYVYEDRSCPLTALPRRGNKHLFESAPGRATAPGRSARGRGG